MSIIHNALSGALAAQAALAATSQNVANVMTPGYTRQGVLLASVAPRQTGALSAGSGVTTRACSCGAPHPSSDNAPRLSRTSPNSSR
jgi:flagellar hook-associated protein 1 FlgK